MSSKNSTYQASERFNRTIADIAERLERESAGFVTYLNDEVVPCVRQHSTKALRVVSQELGKLADYLDTPKHV
jgi:nitrogen fixation protein FixH